MHVAAQAQKVIALLHQKTLVSTLKQVTARAMPPIEIHRVRNQQPMHPTAQICPMRLRNQMKMVAHQNKTQNRGLKTLRRFAQQFHKSGAITLIVKNCLAGIASCAEMINGIFKLYSQGPRHSLSPSEPHRQCQMFRFDPFSSSLPLTNCPYNQGN